MSVDPFEKLAALTREQLVERYDTAAQHVGTGYGITYLRDEIFRRDSEEQTRRIVDMTGTMRNLTWAIFILTVINVLLVLTAYALPRAAS